MEKAPQMSVDFLARIPRLYSGEHNPDPIAWLRFYTPRGTWQWFATELDPQQGRCFGWCDDGRGGGELGYFLLEELTSGRDPHGACLVALDVEFVPQSLAMARKRYGC